MNQPLVQIETPIDFLIITALKEERDAVLKLLESPRKIQRDGVSTYYIASVTAYAQNGSYEVAVTMLNDMGNVEAAQHTTRALQELAPDYVLMVGIAGGVRGKVKLGDIIVARQVWYYEPAKVNPEGTQLRPIMYTVDPMLLDRTQNYTDLSWRDLIQVNRPSRRTKKLSSEEQSDVIFGAIATGEKVVGDIEFMKQIRKIHPKIIGVEMEAFGVAVAAANNRDRPRFIAIRGICDFADRTKNDAWHHYAAESAAAFTIGFLKSGPVAPRSARVARLQQNATLVAIRHQSMEQIPSKALISSLPPEYADHHVVELAVDQTDLYQAGRLANPMEAIRRQQDLENRLNELLSQYPHAEVAYYSIAHIPLLFLAGYQSSNRRSILFFDFNRQTRTWNQLQLGGSEEQLVVTGLPFKRTRARGDVVIRMSISYRVTSDVVEEVVHKPIASISLSLTPPKIDKITSEQQIREYGVTFRHIMDQIHERLPNTTAIHIFYSGPPAFAFYCGQQISKTIHPKIVVYNYVAKDTPSYSWGIDITGDISSGNLLVQPRC